MLKRFVQRVTGRGATNSVPGSSVETKQPKAAAPKSSSGNQPKKSDRKPGSLDQPRKQRWSIEDFQVEPKEGEVRFHDFDLPYPVMRAIHDLGFKYCTPIQAKVLAHLGEGRNIAGRAQTGTGKTAAFLLSVFSEFWRKEYGKKHLPTGCPRALVLAPTRELCLQIVEDARKLAKYCRFNCVAVYGGTQFDRQLKEIQAEPVDLIAATPGRLLDCIRRRVINLKQLDTLIIDEADRMLDMGFIPDVSSIIRATPPKEKRRTMLFSATLTDDVLNLASKWAPDPLFCEVDPEQVAVDTVQQIVYIVTAREKFTILYNMLKAREGERVLIFGNRRDSTKRLNEKLQDYGFRTAYLAGSVDQDKRQKVMQDFKSGKVKIVVATDVAGRGLHVDDISLVVNYDFPYEAEDYVHRIGRTGRARESGTSVSFACENESFVIPEIEEYIGHDLKCIVPADELLAELPSVKRRPRSAQRQAPKSAGGRGRGRRGTGRSR